MRRFICDSVNFIAIIIDTSINDNHILKIFLPNIKEKTYVNFDIIDTISNKRLTIDEWYDPKDRLIKHFI